jgi:adenylate cyclase
VSGLSAAEVARRAGSSEEYVHRLAAAGALSSGEGPFRSSDVQRVRFTAGLEEAGIPIELLARGIAEGEMSLEGLDTVYPDPPALTATTYVRLAEEEGVSFDRVRRLALELGLPQPAPEDPVREDDARMLAAFLRGWAPAGPAEAARIARLLGTSARGLVESYLQIVGPAFMRYFQEPGLPVEERARRTAALGAEASSLLLRMLEWLVERQLEHATTQSAVVNVEDAFERLGYRAQRPERVPAIAFLDLAGFTSLAERQGDAAAAALAADLGDLVQERAAAHAGRAVKWLGDGAMFHFGSPAGAVAAALEMVEQAPGRGLPPARVGVDAGPVVLRDGDYFGRTVNLAARIAGYARPGEVLVSDRVREHAGPEREFEPVGPAELKGIADPVELFRAVPA